MFRPCSAIIRLTKDGDNKGTFVRDVSVIWNDLFGKTLLKKILALHFSTLIFNFLWQYLERAFLVLNLNWIVSRYAPSTNTRSWKLRY